MKFKVGDLVTFGDGLNNIGMILCISPRHKKYKVYYPITKTYGLNPEWCLDLLWSVEDERNK